MKVLTKVMIALGVTMSAVSVAQANPELVAADDYVTSKICVVATEGSQTKLRNAIQESGLSLQYVARKVSCNGMPIADFVEQYGENVANINEYITGGKYSGQLISRVSH